VTRTHHREVPSIESREPGLPETLHDREDCGINEPDPEIAVLRAELEDPFVVIADDLLYE